MTKYNNIFNRDFYPTPNSVLDLMMLDFKNETVLEKLKTGSEIKALSSVIAEREAYYINYWNKCFLPDLEDLEENMASVCNEARKRTEPEIREQLARVEFIPTGSINIEGKIMHYKQLKNMLK